LIGDAHGDPPRVIDTVGRCPLAVPTLTTGRLSTWGQVVVLLTIRH
jgi:hypothetical protein